jgi:hypothetical protein
MTEVVYAIAIWLLVATLFAWLFGRAAERLRQHPPTPAEVLLAQARLAERAMREPRVFDPESVWRAVRIYERV